MGMSLVVVILAAWGVYNGVTSLLSVPFEHWTWMSWATVAMIVVLLAVFVVALRRTIRNYKAQMEKVKVEQEKEMEKLRAKRRAVYLDEDIDIEAEAEKAQAAREAAAAAAEAGESETQADTEAEEAPAKTGEEPEKTE